MADSGLDLQAFGRLVEAHHAAVHAVAFAVTRDVALADDVAQDTFITAWAEYGQLRDPARLRPWLCGMARNMAKNALRRRAREVAPVETIDARPSVVDTAIDREAERELATALAAIPDAYREPLVLFYWEEQSIYEVATSLAISPEAAQKRISRARTYVKEHLVARLATSGRARKQASAAAAVAIVALLAKSGAASAATTKGTTMLAHRFARVLVLAATATAIVGGIAIYKHSTGDAAPSRMVAVAPSGSASRAAASAPAPTLPAAAAATMHNLTPGQPSPQRTFGTPSAYELTVLAPTSVAVELAGGTAPVFLWQDPPKPTFERHVRGRVVDEAGRGVAGAVVLVGASFRAMMGSMQASEGAMSGSDGSFDVVVHRDTAELAMAMHGRGWSAPVAVPAGKTDATITVALPAPGTLAIHTRQSGAPREAALYITARHLELVIDTDARGDFELPNLAPGSYHVSARSLQQYLGGTGPAAEQDVVVSAGTTSDVKLDLRSGTLVIVTPHHATKLSTIEYFLVPGTEQLPLAELTARARAGKIMDTLFGGQDLDQPMQFHDVPAGTYTLCVDAKPDRDTHLPLQCKPLEVADKPTLEVDVTL